MEHAKQENSAVEPVIVDSNDVASLSIENERSDVVRVLIVDDDEDLLAVIKCCLEENGNFHIKTALSAREALVIMAVENFDVVVSDYEMPETNGLEFLEQLRKESVVCPFILFTGKGREEVAAKALSLGAFRYINKHGDSEAVYAELATSVKQAADQANFEKAMITSEKRFKAILEASRDAIVVIDDFGKVVFLNSTSEDMFGFTENCVGKNFLEELSARVSESDRHCLSEALNSLSRSKKTQTRKGIQVAFSVCSAEKRNVEVSLSSFSEGNNCFVTAVCRDFTERNKAEEELRASEESYRTLFEQTGDYILVLKVRPEGVPTIHDANDCALTMHGYNRDEIIGKPITFLDVNSSEAVIMERIRCLLKTQKLTFEAKHRRKDGTEFVVEVTNKRVKIGRKDFILSIERDITQRRKTEDKLRQDRSILEALTKSIDAGFVIISKDYRILWANDFIRNYKGDVDGKLCYTVLNTLDSPCVDCGVTKIYAGTATTDAHEYYSTTIDGKPYCVDIIAAPIRDADGNIVSASELCVDITEKKQKEHALEESQNEFKALFESNPEAVIYADENYRIVDTNAKFSEVFGYTLDEVKGKDLIKTLVPEELRAEEHQVANGLKAVSFESKRRRKDGSLASVAVSIAPVIVKGKRVGYVGVYKDISQIIKTQEELARALSQAELMNDKLDVIGGFTRHDVRNKLATINGNVYLAKKHSQGNQTLQENLKQIEQAIRNVTRILEFARSYEMLGSQKLKPIDVCTAFDEAVSLFTTLNTVSVIKDCKNFSVLADSMLTTIFHNLIENSLKYGQKITEIKVRAQNGEDGSSIISYEDDGVGIPSESKGQLFQKGFGKGTGFGLYLIKRTCDIYGWTVKENGEPGKGAKFEFCIPPRAVVQEK